MFMAEWKRQVGCEHGCAQRCVSEEERVVKAHTAEELRNSRNLLALSSDSDLRVSRPIYRRQNLLMGL